MESCGNSYETCCWTPSPTRVWLDGRDGKMAFSSLSNQTKWPKCGENENRIQGWLMKSWVEPWGMYKCCLTPLPLTSQPKPNPFQFESNPFSSQKEKFLSKQKNFQTDTTTSHKYCYLCLAADWSINLAQMQQDGGPSMITSKATITK